jgi:anaerobic selenocysteine-containing dehydrogenase
VERNRNGGDAVRAILALPAVAGKFGVRGGGLTMSLSRASPLNRDALARPDLRRHPVRRLNMTQLGRILLETRHPAVRALFVYNANPVAMTPDQTRVVAGLSRSDLFTVVHDQVLTDTARFADWLLPAQTFLEHEELHRSYGHYVVQHAAPVVAPEGESLSNPELFARLARAMGFEEPELRATPSDLLAAALDCDRRRLDGADEARLRRDKAVALRFDGAQAPVAFGNDFPSTPSGRVELSPASLGAMRYRPLESSYPLALLSPASGRTVNSIFGEVGGEGRLDLNPADAAARGIADGAVVRIYNELGEVRVRARVTDEVRPGVASLPKGLWRSSTLNGWTSTVLVPDTLTAIGEGACFNDARIEVEPLA